MSTTRKTAKKTTAKKDQNRDENKVIAGLIQLFFVAVFVIGSFVVSGMLKASKKELGTEAPQDRILFAESQTLSPASYRISFDTTGVVQTRSDIAVTPQVSGKVVKVNDAFFEGGTFKAGEVLFEIEAVDFELEIQRLQSSVAQARTAFNLEEAEGKAAVEDWKLVNPNTPAPSLVARKPQRAEAWANLKAAKAQLQSAKLNLARTKFSFPFDGKVLSSSLEEGQSVIAGQSYGRVYETALLEVQASVQKDQMQWITDEGQADITIRYEAEEGEKTAKGIIKRGVSSINSQTRFASLNVAFDKTPNDILPGVFVDLHVKGPTIDNVFTIPVNAVQKGNVIWALDDDNHITAFDGEIIFSNNTEVVVKSSNPSLRIVTSKLPGAIEGMSVKLADIVEAQQ